MPEERVIEIWRSGARMLLPYSLRADQLDFEQGTRFKLQVDPIDFALALHFILDDSVAANALRRGLSSVLVIVKELERSSRTPFPYLYRITIISGSHPHPPPDAGTAFVTMQLDEDGEMFVSPQAQEGLFRGLAGISSLSPLFKWAVEHPDPYFGGIPAHDLFMDLAHWQRPEPPAQTGGGGGPAPAPRRVERYVRRRHAGR